MARALMLLTSIDLTDEQLVFHIDPVDLFRCRSEQDLQAAFDPCHYGSDLPGRDDDLLLNELGRIQNL
jgi:hypothetical protein